MPHPVYPVVESVEGRALGAFLGVNVFEPDGRAAAGAVAVSVLVAFTDACFDQRFSPGLCAQAPGVQRIPSPTLGNFRLTCRPTVRTGACQ